VLSRNKNNPSTFPGAESYSQVSMGFLWRAIVELWMIFQRLLLLGSFPASSFILLGLTLQFLNPFWVDFPNFDRGSFILLHMNI
jgi:hypothetical protein